MLSRFLPLLFLVTGIAAGAGMALMPTGGKEPPGAAQRADHAGTGSDTHPEAGSKSSSKNAGVVEGKSGAGRTEYVRLNNQFVVPVLDRDRVAALVVMSLSIEARAGLREEIYAREPRLRDAFLQVMFDHANMGGFHGAFTDAETLGLLRTALREVAQRELGPDARNVLIVDIARQDS